jgi:hypothetical protein
MVHRRLLWAYDFAWHQHARERLRRARRFRLAYNVRCKYQASSCKLVLLPIPVVPAKKLEATKEDV